MRRMRGGSEYELGAWRGYSVHARQFAGSFLNSEVSVVTRNNILEHYIEYSGVYVSCWSVMLSSSRAG